MPNRCALHIPPGKVIEHTEKLKTLTRIRDENPERSPAALRYVMEHHVWGWVERAWDKRRGGKEKKRVRSRRRGVTGREGTVMGRMITLERTKSRISYWRKKNDLLIYCHLNYLKE